MKYIKMFESFSREQEINNVTTEEERIKNRIPKKNDKIRMGDRVYIEKNYYRCVESDDEGNTCIQQVINNGEDLGDVITLSDKQVIEAEPIGIKDSDEKYSGWKVKEEKYD